MPRKKGARLWLKPAEYEGGKVRKRAVWCIVDGRTVVARFPEECHAEAEKTLGQYLASKHSPSHRRDQELHEVFVTDVLAIYAEEVVTGLLRPEKYAARLEQLADWWEGKTLADVTGRTCREYVKWRTSQAWKSAKPSQTGNKPRMVTPAGVRRELEDMRAAINHHRKEGYTRSLVEVWMPPKSAPRERYLERWEAARLVRYCYRQRDVQVIPRGKRKGQAVVTAKQSQQHIARFILIGLYTGTRAGSIAAAGFEKREGVAWIDLEKGVFYRRPVGKRETKKRQPPVRLPRGLLQHLRRWKRLGISRDYVVEWRGKPVQEVSKGFRSACRAVGLPDTVTPHTLRHTAATWLMQRGADLWDAAGYLGMSVKILEEVYGHHRPDFQEDVASRIRGDGKKDRKKDEAA